MKEPKSYPMPPANFTSLPKDVAATEDDCGVSHAYLRSADTEAYRVRMDRRTLRAVENMRTAYCLMGGRMPSISLLLRRAVAAHSTDVTKMLAAPADKRKQFVEKMLQGAA